MNTFSIDYDVENNQFYYTHKLTKPLITDGFKHIHDTYELYYFLSGDVTYYIEGQTFKLQSNDLLIINNRELHRPQFDSTQDYDRIYIQFLPEFVSAFRDKSYDILHFYEKRKLGSCNHLSSQEVRDHNIQHYFNQIELYVKSDKVNKHVMIKTLFIQLMVKLNELYSMKMDSADESEVYDYNSKIVEILDFINNNLNEKISLDLLEKKFFVNKHYLCHVFKKNTGFSIMEYVIHKRIMKAKELLQMQKSVIDTCHAVGFNDYSNFYKVFKKLTGMSPSEFSR